jgi:trk system potassium uptake protein TrkH
MGDRVQYSIFHSISAFCNAGFGLYGRSLMDYRSTWQVNVVFPVLIIGGGMGFMVLYNFARLVRYRASGWRQAPLVKRRLRLQPKLALTTTVVLLVVGTGLVFLFEAMPGHNRPAGATNASPAAAGDFPALGPAGLGPMGGKWTDQLEGAWFLSVTARTAGFNSTDTSLLAPSTKFLTILLMFIGASPGSTGGGIKTVTLAVIVVGVWSALRGYGSAQAFRRTIAPGLVLRALTILAISVMWVALVTLVVAAWGLRDGSQCTFLDVLFETVSAYATVGLSTGTTTVLNTVGRVLIVATMYVGRVGPLTLFVAMPVGEGEQRYDYPTENVAIS